MKYRQPSEKSRGSSRQQQNQQRSSLWVGLILFISAWVFLLGVLVGRESAPILFNYRKIGTELADIAKNEANNKQALKDGEKDPLAALDDLDFYKKLKEKTADIPEFQLPAPDKSTEAAANLPKPLAQKPEGMNTPDTASTKLPEMSVKNAHSRQTPLTSRETGIRETSIDHKPGAWNDWKSETPTERPPGKFVDRKPEIPIEHKAETRAEHKPEIPVERKPETRAERKPEMPVDQKAETSQERFPKTEPSQARRPDVTARTSETQTQQAAAKTRELPSEQTMERVDHSVEAAKTEPQKVIRSAYDLMKAQPVKEAPTAAPESHASEPKTTHRLPVETRSQTMTHSRAAEARPPAKAPAKPPLTQKSVTLQMPSLTDRQTADDQVAALQKKGIHAWKVARMVPGKGVWYQVVVGKYGAAQADAIKNRLKQDHVDVTTAAP